MGNSLGAMVFIVAGVAMGYWVFTGRAQNFLRALNTGQTQTQQSNTNAQGSTGPAMGSASSGSWGNPGPTLHIPGAFALGE